VTELRSLKVLNFRNIEDAEVNITSPFVCFCGDNAQGKTNILEAFYLTTNIRSFRTGNIADWIRKDQKQAYVSAKIADNLGDYTIGYSLDKNERKFFIDKNKLKGIRDIISRIRVISYSPSSYELVLGEDGERRRFLDRVVYSIDSSHLNDLVCYNKTLKNRNASIKQKEDYTMWDNMLSKYGSRIIKKRILAIEMMQSYLSETFNLFFDNKKRVSLNYLYTAGVEDDQILNKLKKIRKTDEDQKSTTVGPHRDKLEILFDGVEAKRIVSTGQAKLISFIFKISKLRFIKGYSKKNPIFLYDDVSAFLDEKRLLQLIEIIKKENVQIISTAVDNSLFKKLFSDSVQFITVREGRVLNDR